MKIHDCMIGLLAMVTASCSVREAGPGDSSSPDIFFGSIENTAENDTKVYADETLHIRWHQDDRISLFNKNTSNQEYRFMGQTGDNSGNFERINGGDNAETLPFTYAVYPFDASASIDKNGGMHITLPSEQSYSSHSFGQGANLMVASSSDNTLIFKNACGYLMFKLYGKGLSVSSLTLRGNNGEFLAGKATVTASPETDPAVTIMQSDATTSVTLQCSTPVPLGSSADDFTEFWLALPPTVFSKGITITVSLSDGSLIEKTSTECISVYRNVRSRLSPLGVSSNAPTSISLNYKSVSMEAGDTFKLTATVKPDNAADKSVQWSSTNPSIASVDGDGLVTALSQGNTTIIATTVNGLTAQSSISVSNYFYNGYVAVDLGLSVKWATKNIGANKSTASGGYYAWGECNTKKVYDSSTYKWRTSSGSITKYNDNDNLTTLQSADDVAHKLWGEDWRMPTSKEYKELVNNCDWKWVTVNNVEGMRFTSKKNGRSIFLPDVGYKSGERLVYEGIYYWSSTRPKMDIFPSAHALYAVSGAITVGLSHSRYCGLPVRAVHE